MRNKPYVGALGVSGEHLVLIALKHAEEVLSDRDLPAPRGRGLTDKELKMAEELVHALEGELKLEDFRDEYRNRVLQFVEAKAKGKKPRLHAVQTKSATTALAGDLAKSLAALKRGREKERKVA
jgi:non-homologous end joining protein Ku